jgi:hypothetical protein
MGKKQKYQRKRQIRKLAEMAQIFVFPGTRFCNYNRHVKKEVSNIFLAHITPA